MNKFTLAMGLTTLTLAGTAGGLALAQADAPRPARPMMMADPFGTATVTRAEAQARAGEMFARMDANKDGKLDQADRQARMAARLDETFARMDANKDGRIDKAEFVAAHQPPANGQPGAMGMGPMGRDSMEMGRMRGMGHGPMMGRMDANGDRAITRDEFIAGALKRFDAADANKDGKLTPEERRTAMREHKGERMHHRMGGHCGMNGMDGMDAMDGHDMPPPPAQ